jgi:hypothetical protein
MKKVVVHTFTLGEVEDPDLYAAEPIYTWEKSDAGKWVMKNSIDIPIWHRMYDVNTYGYDYTITATLTEEDNTYFILRFK